MTRILRIIPLNAVRAFTVAARLESFSRAARELNVTHGAISKQIRALEKLIGRELFFRTGRGVQLTETGRELAEQTTLGLNQIEQAFVGYLEKGRRVIKITTLPSFAAAFLAPRLGKFNQAHPKILLEIETTARLVDFKKEIVDIGLRFGAGTWPGLTAVPISTGVLMPVCSPEFEKRFHSKTPGEILRQGPLLHNLTAKEWQAWMREAGFPGLKTANEYTFSDTNVIIQAALEGQGLALLPKILVQKALKSGTLLSPFGPEVEGLFRFWIVAPKETFQRGNIKILSDWLIKEAGAAEAP